MFIRVFSQHQATSEASHRIEIPWKKKHRTSCCPFFARGCSPQWNTQHLYVQKMKSKSGTSTTTNPVAAGTSTAHPAGALLLLGTARDTRRKGSTQPCWPRSSLLCSGQQQSLCKRDVATKSQRRKPSKVGALTGQGKTRSSWGQERSQPEMTTGCRAGKAPESQAALQWQKLPPLAAFSAAPKGLPLAAWEMREWVTLLWQFLLLGRTFAH